MTESLLMNGLLAFVAGALMNFTPCVLPVIPFKIRALINEVGSQASHRFAAALAFLLGSLAFFASLGAATAWLGLMWGSLFQSKAFLAGLSIFLLLAAIAMFAEWTFNLPQLFYKTPGHRYIGAFFTGAVAGVLSTPCAGPFLGSVLAYAFTQPPAVILSIYVAIGFGLAFPYLVILAWPGLLNRMSATRAWAGQVKKLLGLVLLGGALFFGQSLLPSASHDFLWAALAAFAAAWVVHELVQARAWASRALPLLFVVLVGAGSGATVFQPKGVDWVAFTEPALQERAAAGSPVLIEFTADWCLNCKVLERTVFSDPAVVSRLQELGYTAFLLDMTEYREPDQQVLQRYGGTALPYAVILDGRGQVARTFSGMYTVEELLAALDAGVAGAGPAAGAGAK